MNFYQEPEEDLKINHDVSNTRLQKHKTQIRCHAFSLAEIPHKISLILPTVKIREILPDIQMAAISNKSA